MSRNIPTYIRLLSILAIILIVAGYIFFNSRVLIRGPQIIIETPNTGVTVTESMIEIKGQAINVSFISVNDRPIFIDEEGFFNESLLLQEGYNIIIIEAKDKFNREIKKQLDLVYELE